jgi:hypothetical protein
MRGGGWAAWATVVVAALGMLVSTPRAAGADEPVHASTAWYVSTHVLPPREPEHAGAGPIPGLLASDPCYAGHPEHDASCIVPRAAAGTVATFRVVGYPPVYYWVTGIGQHVAAAALPGWEDIGGRLASILLNLGLLTLIGLHMRRRHPLWGTYLLCVVTPMVAFYWAVVNPSGWETTTALTFAYVFSQAWWVREDDSRDHTLSRSRLAVVAGSSLLLGLARPAAFVWLTCLILSVVALRPSRLDRRSRIRSVAAAASGVVAGVAWYLAYRSDAAVSNPSPLADPSPASYAIWFEQSLDAILTRAREVFGVLGWLDTAMPGWLFLVSLVGYTVFLTQLHDRQRIPGRALLVGLAAGLILPSVLEALGWNAWPMWWQGRYTLPFLAGFVLLLLLRSAHLVPRRVTALSLLATASLAIMVWLNTMRYAFGLSGNLPSRLHDPAMNATAMTASLACVVALVVLGGVRGWDLYRSRA